MLHADEKINELWLYWHGWILEGNSWVHKKQVTDCYTYCDIISMKFKTANTKNIFYWYYTLRLKSVSMHMINWKFRVRVSSVSKGNTLKEGCMCEIGDSCVFFQKQVFSEHRQCVYHFLWQIIWYSMQYVTCFRFYLLGDLSMSIISVPTFAITNKTAICIPHTYVFAHLFNAHYTSLCFPIPRRPVQRSGRAIFTDLELSASQSCLSTLV